MASLLVSVVNDHNNDPYNDVKAIKRGDVLAVQEDTFPWGGVSLSDPRFRVMVFPGATENEASVLLSEEKATEESSTPNPMLQLRGFHLNLDDSQDEDFNHWLMDDSRATPVYRVIHQELAAFIKKKVPVAVPTING